MYVLALNVFCNHFWWYEILDIYLFIYQYVRVFEIMTVTLFTSGSVLILYSSVSVLWWCNISYIFLFHNFCNSYQKIRKKKGKEMSALIFMQILMPTGNFQYFLHKTFWQLTGLTIYALIACLRPLCAGDIMNLKNVSLSPYWDK